MLEIWVAKTARLGKIGHVSIGGDILLSKSSFDAFYSDRRSWLFNSVSLSPF